MVDELPLLLAAQHERELIDTEDLRELLMEFRRTAPYLRRILLLAGLTFLINIVLGILGIIWLVKTLMG